MLNAQNRRSFLHDVSLALGRNDIPDYVEPLDYSKGPQHKLMAGLNEEELLEAFKSECNNLAIKFRETDEAGLADTLLEVINEYGGGKVIYPQSEEVAAFGIEEAFQAAEGQEGLSFVAWDKEKSGEYNIANAQDANIGITFPMMAIAETGTVMQAMDADTGRSVGLLPLTHIAVLRRSTIQPRMTQTMAKLSELYQESPADFPSLMVHISGPSSTVDIELVRVVGVHGPINVTYVILND